MYIYMIKISVKLDKQTHTHTHTHTHIYIYIYIYEVVYFGESDKMIEISGKVGKSEHLQRV